MISKKIYRLNHKNLSSFPNFSFWLKTFERFYGQKFIFGNSHGNLGFPTIIHSHSHNPGNSGNNAPAQIFIPIPKIPGNSGNGNGNSHQFPFPAHLWLKYIFFEPKKRWVNFYGLNAIWVKILFFSTENNMGYFLWVKCKMG